MRMTMARATWMTTYTPPRMRKSLNSMSSLWKAWMGRIKPARTNTRVLAMNARTSQNSCMNSSTSGLMYVRPMVPMKRPNATRASTPDTWK